MAQKVNLDALIKRDDLDITFPGEPDPRRTFSLAELGPNKTLYRLLRKPEFQRETNDWTVDNVVTLIKSFRDKDLIPALIMWGAESGHVFVIDGAHRLSALIAWVHDDYGDEAMSQEFFKGHIPRQQILAAKACRERVRDEIGTYKSLSSVFESGAEPSPEKIKWSSNLSREIETQWVIGSASAAERSFLVINARSVEIDDTEKYMVEARHKANVIAARAIVRSGAGYEFWAKFPNSKEISGQAKAIHDALFSPEVGKIETTMDLPIGGTSYSAEGIRLALDSVNYVNGYKTRASLESLKNDDNGEETLRFLQITSAVLKHVTGPEPASLGLHPSVYFWGATGNHQAAAFLAMLRLVQEWMPGDGLVRFTYKRAEFEEFLVSRHMLVKGILSRIGGWEKSVPTVMRFYTEVLRAVEAGNSFEEIEHSILSDGGYVSTAFALKIDETTGKRVKRETKAAIARRTILESSPRCAICFARLQYSLVSHDHITNARDGGAGSESNVRITHKYCNHGFRNHIEATGKPPITKPAWLAAIQGV